MSGEQILEAVVQLSFLALIIAGIYYVGARKKADPLLTNRPSVIESFMVPTDPDNAFKIILKFADITGYKVVAMDELLRAVVLDEGVKMSPFYPIYVSSRGDMTVIEVGLEPRVGAIWIRWIAGVLVRKRLQSIVNNLKAVFLAK
jgi:hypothetical protein